MVAFGFAIGPLIGGALAQKVSWRVSPSVSTCVQSASDKQPFADLLDVVVLLGHAPISFVAMCSVLLVLPLKSVEGSLRRYVPLIECRQVKLALRMNNESV